MADAAAPAERGRRRPTRQGRGKRGGCTGKDDGSVSMARIALTVLCAQGEIFQVPGDTQHPGTHFERDIR